MIQVKLFIKWAFLVWLNAVVSFALALGDMKQIDVVGVIAGVFTFVAIYTAIDDYLLKKQALTLRKSLLISVCVKAFTQLYPVIEMMTGAASLGFIAFLSFDKIPFISTYFTTLIDGVLLSIVVGLFMLTGKFALFLKLKLKSS